MIKKLIILTFKLFIIVALVGLIFGSLSQYLFDRKIDKEFVPTGKFVNTSQGKIHYDVIGSGDYTFVLEAGLGETMATWSKIKDSLAKLGNVVMYDRAGLGYSDESDKPKTSEAIAEQLNDVLTNAKIKGPYILVGHSIGGTHLRHYANKYSENVAGIFLIDPALKELIMEFPKISFKRKIYYYVLTDLTWTGIPYYALTNRGNSTSRTSKGIRTYGRESKALFNTIEELKSTKDNLSHISIYIISAVSPEDSDYEIYFRNAYISLIEKSQQPTRKLIEYEAPHNIQITNPNVVIDGIKEFINEISKHNEEEIVSEVKE